MGIRGLFCQDYLGIFAIFCHLRFKRLDIVEFFLAAKASNELAAKPLAVEVNISIQKMDLQQPALLIIEARAKPKARGAIRQDLLAMFCPGDADRIDAGRWPKSRSHRRCCHWRADIRCWETKFPASPVALDDPPFEQKRMAQEIGGEGHIASNNRGSDPA